MAPTLKEFRNEVFTVLEEHFVGKDVVPKVVDTPDGNLAVQVAPNRFFLVSVTEAPR